MITDEIIAKENLKESITKYLLNGVKHLVHKGYSKEDAEKAIAGALPYCIFKDAQLR